MRNASIRCYPLDTEYSFMQFYTLFKRFRDDYLIAKVKSDSLFSQVYAEL